MGVAGATALGEDRVLTGESIASTGEKTTSTTEADSTTGVDGALCAVAAASGHGDRKALYVKGERSEARPKG